MYITIDIGGTKTLIAVFNESGEIEEQIKFKTPVDYTEFSQELAKSVDSLTTKEFAACGLAAPAKIDRTHGVAIAFGNLDWTDVPLQEIVEEIVKCPVVIENDANLAGLSEALRVQDAYRKVLYITVSTGIGGVMVIDGKIDPNTQDAEIGHILLEHDGQLMRWQEFASGKAIVARTGMRASDIPVDSPLWYGVARNIAIGLIDVIATLTPDAIIVGGGVGSHFDKYGDRLKEQLKIYENPLVTIPPVFGAFNAEEAVIYGCYEIAKSTYPTT